MLEVLFKHTVDSLHLPFYLQVKGGEEIQLDPH